LNKYLDRYFHCMFYSVYYTYWFWSTSRYMLWYMLL